MAALHLLRMSEPSLKFQRLGLTITVPIPPNPELADAANCARR